MAHFPSFIKSALHAQDFPQHEGCEIAFLGASNSGKSTLVNALLGKELCKTSSKPGHTSLINFFNVRKGLIFVDLPGYGYAKKSKKEQKEWQDAIEKYLIGRDQLVCCMVLFDLKRGILANDKALVDWLDSSGVPFSLVATKVDKLNQKDKSAAKKKVLDQLLNSVILTSSKKGTGIPNLWSHIDGMVDLSASQQD